MITVLIALLLHFSKRLNTRKILVKNDRLSLQLASLGYAVPGTVLAIGLLSPLTFADHQLHAWLKSLELSPVGLIFQAHSLH